MWAFAINHPPKSFVSALTREVANIIKVSIATDVLINAESVVLMIKIFGLG